MQRNSAEELARLRELRCHFDRALIILDVLKKREMYKRDYVRNLQDVSTHIILRKKLIYSSQIVEVLAHGDGNLQEKSSHTSNTKRAQSSHSPTHTTTSHTPSHSTTSERAKQTPKKGTQLTLDSFLSPKTSTNNNAHSESRKLRSPNQTTSPAQSPHSTRSTRRCILPDHASSSSEESIAQNGSSGSPDSVKDDDEEMSSSSENEGMVPKSRAHLRRAAANRKAAKHSRRRKLTL